MIVSSSAVADSKSLIVGSITCLYCLTHQLALVQDDGDAIAGLDRCGAANDRRPIGVPTHRVPASEDGQGAERIEARRERAKPRLRAILSPAHRDLQSRIGG